MGLATNTAWLDVQPANDLSLAGGEALDTHLPAFFEGVDWLCRAMDLAAIGEDGEPHALELVTGRLIWRHLGYEPMYAVRLPGIAAGALARASDIAVIVHIARHFDEYGTIPADTPEVFVNPSLRRLSGR